MKELILSTDSNQIYPKDGFNSESLPMIKEFTWARESEQFPGSLTSIVPLETQQGVTICEKIRENLHKWENSIAFVRRDHFTKL